MFSTKKIFAYILAQFRISRNQQRKHERRDEVLSSLGTQDVNTSGNHVSGFVDIEFQ